MEVNSKVKTIYGIGTIIRQEGKEGILSKCFLVKLPLKNLSASLKKIQNQNGGLCFMEKELEDIK